MDWFLWIYFTATASFWCLFYFKSVRLSRALPAIPQQLDLINQPLPRLSVIITAKDEATTIEHALATILNTSYPDFEIIIVNDRSTDTTGEIINDFARSHPKIKPIHIDTLPEDWLGKTHALDTAVRQATGDWFLFTDADVHHHPTLWQRALNYAISKHYSHLALLPDVPTPGRILQACVKAFGLMFLATAKVEQIEDPDKKAAIGIGAFNLVKRDAFVQTPGFEWLRMEVADDYGIGVMMKKWGHKISFATAYDDLQVDWYHDVPGMIKGLEKNIMAPGTRFETIRLIISPLLLSAVILGPFLSLLSWSNYYFVTGVTVLFFIVLCSFWIPRRNPGDLTTWLLTPVGYLIILYTFCRACALCLARNGINWRGTYYPRSQLRKYQRVKV
jgi:glycosyltransferase involved in cell wall biosynthesis